MSAFENGQRRDEADASTIEMLVSAIQRLSPDATGVHMAIAKGQIRHGKLQSDAGLA